jgi:uncharacterized phiE125 gp8 family phage protein
VNASWVLTIPPVVEPLSVQDVKANLRVEVSTDDLLLARLIRGCRGQAEEYLGRGFLPQTWRYTQDVWTNTIRLPRAPLRSVVVKYYDAAGVLRTLASSAYLVDTDVEPGVVRLAPNQVWPALQAFRPAAVQVTYVVGYADAGAIPPAIVDGVHLLVGRRYQRRGDDSPDRDSGPLDNPPAEALLAPYRVFWYAPSECLR